MLSRVPTFNRSGFTLVEVMVSLACMGIAFVALWAVHYASLQTDIRTDLETRAVLAAHSRLDSLRTLPFTSAQLADGNHTSTLDAPLTTCTATVTTDPSFAWKKTVTVTVPYSEKVGAFGGTKVMVQRSVQMSSIVVNLN